MAAAERPDGVLVRRAELSDAPVIAQLLRDFNLEFGDICPSASFLSERFRQLISHGETVVLLELEEETAAGLAVLRFRPAIWSEGFECYLAELYVVPDRRGRGFGRALMQEAIIAARERNADTMNIEVDEPDLAARRLYESLGFSNREDGGKGPLMFVYERDL